jgi:hypothetical protein
LCVTEALLKGKPVLTRIIEDRLQRGLTQLPMLNEYHTSIYAKFSDPDTASGNNLLRLYYNLTAQPCFAQSTCILEMVLMSYTTQ